MNFAKGVGLILGFLVAVVLAFSISFFPILGIFNYFFGDWGILPAALIYLSLLFAVNRKLNKMITIIKIRRLYDR